MFKYNKIKIEATLEEAGRHRDRGANQGLHMHHPSIISSP